MGIRPDNYAQAAAWATAAGATGLAGALIATFFYHRAPTVGETLGIVAFVTVSLGGFGSIPGALIAGFDRRHRILVGLSARNRSASDMVVYALFLGFLLVPAAVACWAGRDVAVLAPTFAVRAPPRHAPFTNFGKLWAPANLPFWCRFSI